MNFEKTQLQHEAFHWPILQSPYIIKPAAQSQHLVEHGLAGRPQATDPGGHLFPTKMKRKIFIRLVKN